MNKILSFIVNEKREFLLLKGNKDDPQLKKSIWYVVTGGCEKFDKTIEDTVRREIKEEINLDAQEIVYLNWILKYMSLGIECIEYVYITFVNQGEIILNEENIDYKWCNFNEFIEKIDWFGDKSTLKLVLEKALNKKIVFSMVEMTRIE